MVHPTLPLNISSNVSRTISALLYPMPKRSTPQGLYITPKLSESKHGHQTIYPKRLPRSSNMRLTGTLRSTVTRMLTSTPMKMPQPDREAPDLTHQHAVPRL